MESEAQINLSVVEPELDLPREKKKSNYWTILIRTGQSREHVYIGHSQ